jgi:hypothetical protein
MLAMPSSVPVSLVGGGADTANLGSVGSSVQAILSPVSITDPSSFINVAVDDAANAISSRFVTVSSTGSLDTIVGLDPSTVTVASGDVGSLTLDGGSAGNTFVISGVSGPPNGTLPVSLNTGTGVDSTFVQGVGSGSSVAVHGQAGNDSSDTTARTVSVGSTAVTGLAPAAINYATVGPLTIDGGSPSATFTVTPSTTITDTIVGGGAPSTTPPGNALDMTLTGTTSPALTGATSPAGTQGTWTFANRRPVSFSHMQSLNPTAVSIGDAARPSEGAGAPCCPSARRCSPPPRSQ